MIDPYENILIGNFLFSIGALLGRASGGLELPASVNLLQQTPLDGPIADVYLSFPGVVRIFEFKRASNRSKKEKKKAQALQARLASLKAIGTDLEPLSKAIHWYVESCVEDVEDVEGEEGQNCRTTVTPYMELGSPVDANRHVQGTIDLPKFCEAMVNGLVSSGDATKRQAEFPPESVKQYMSALAAHAGETGTSSSGFVVMLSKERGLRWIAVPDFREFGHTLRELQAATNRLSASMQSERDMTAIFEEGGYPVDPVDAEELREETDRARRPTPP